MTMPRLSLPRIGFCAVVVVLAGRGASAAEYYVAPTGNDSNPGTMTSPFATIQRGHDVAAAGDTVWIRGGTYRPTTGKMSNAGFVFSKSGTSDTNRIHFIAYPRGGPVLGFSQLQLSTWTAARFYLTGTSLHFEGPEMPIVVMPGRPSH